MTTLTPPTRSHEQRLAALQFANQTRIERARVKRLIKQTGPAAAIAMIHAPTLATATMKVEELVLAIPHYGTVKTRKVMHRAGCSPAKTLAGLTQRQRDALVAELEPSS